MLKLILNASTAFAFKVPVSLPVNHFFFKVSIFTALAWSLAAKLFNFALSAERFVFSLLKLSFWFANTSFLAINSLFSDSTWAKRAVKSANCLLRSVMAAWLFALFDLISATNFAISLLRLTNSSERIRLSPASAKLSFWYCSRSNSAFTRASSLPFRVSSTAVLAFSVLSFSTLTLFNM